MALNPYHTVEELDGQRCSIIEKGISEERAGYIKAILEASRLKIVDVKDAEGKITIGVTDITFNCLHAIYSRRLKTPNGHLVTPALWAGEKANVGFYWENRK